MSFYGLEPPKIILKDRSIIQLPRFLRDSRVEGSKVEKRRRKDPNGEFHEVIEGYRIFAKYSFKAENDIHEDILEIYNTTDIKIKFQKLKREYSVHMIFSEPEFYPYNYDVLTVEFIGTILLKSPPNPDLDYMIFNMAGPKIVLNRADTLKYLGE